MIANLSMKLRKSYLYLLPILIIAAAGVVTPEEYNVLPATSILEVLLVLLVGTVVLKRGGHIAVFGAAAFVYVLYFNIYAYLSNANILDGIVASKSFFYIAAVGLCVKKPILKLDVLIVLLNALLSLFLIKYGYSRFLDGSPRPGVFTENNFELLFLFILAAGVWQLRGYTLWTEIFALILITVLGSSRSGALELLSVLLFAARIDFPRRYIAIEKFIWLAVIPLIIFTVYYVFSARSDGGFDIESIDRYKFLMIFINETSNWDLLNWFKGAAPLTQMSEGVCQSLSFYQDLFSREGTDQCYSLVLHSMILRVVFDHGIIGLIFILSCIWRALGLSGATIRLRISIIVLLLINGAAVSSFNSVYAALPITLLVLCNRNSIKKAATRVRSPLRGA